MTMKSEVVMATALCCAVTSVCLLAAPQEHRTIEQGSKRKEMSWMPPNVSAPLPSIAATPPCSVSDVLREVGGHVLELTNNLENFTAEEQIEYTKRDQNGFLEESDSSAFDYVFAFEQRGGGRSSREYRTPAKGGHAFPASGQDTGLAALALIFHPKMQSDYDMSCEGLDNRKGQSAWVIHFQQRKDKPRRTLQFRTEGGDYAAMLKGRAWISMDNGQVLHLETNLMQDIPAMGLRSSAISVGYAPVGIQSKNLDLWLPQRVEAYWEISSHKIILYHTFTNFKMFTVDTQESIRKPTK
jgi:hypothetical protein